MRLNKLQLIIARDPHAVTTTDVRLQCDGLLHGSGSARAPAVMRWSQLVMVVGVVMAVWSPYRGGSPCSHLFPQFWLASVAACDVEKRLVWTVVPAQPRHEAGERA
ncbi:MAG: hypothetical protein JO266_14370 [Acidobacteria bacterium]|nr:hypothetical protein [Acidobacteriota bacterium]MBV9480428.1 hypothetical protein [Acidobacteriota bacterium]